MKKHYMAISAAWELVLKSGTVNSPTFSFFDIVLAILNYLCIYIKEGNAYINLPMIGLGRVFLNMTSIILTYDIHILE